MKKVLQITLIACAILLAVLVLPVTAFADNGGVTILGGDPGMNGEQYYYTGTNFNVSAEFTHLARNETSLPSSVTYSVSRTKSFDASVSGQASASFLVKKVQLYFSVSPEVGYGESESVSLSITWNIPANSTILCKYGSCVVHTYGYGEHWFYGRLMSTYDISADYTYDSYSEAIPY
ncbi:MAG TPA: hypothetical protein PK675_03975 [Clostridia bacterium]|nr:hypothetical protein [Clostridia bacterium]